jgi:riboflavin synthase
MFTGLIEAVGRVAGVATTATGARLRIQSSLGAELRAGDSLTVNGVCLTAVSLEGDVVAADLGPETARVTTLGTLQQDQRVNLERSMRADGRFGGHFVLGHVDGTARVSRIRSEGDAHWLTIAFDSRLAAYVIPKGSIAVDGISLTVASLDAAQFEVMIVPFTWDHTNLHTLRVGDRVNLECDMIGKYVVRAVELAQSSRLPSTSLGPGKPAPRPEEN